MTSNQALDNGRASAVPFLLAHVKNSMPRLRSQSELPVIPGGWTQQKITAGDESFDLTLPADPDSFLEEPAVIEAFERDDLLPYWTFLWPTARSMANLVSLKPWNPGLRTLEIGAGIGLVGLSGLARGLDVTFSDIEPQAVRLAQHNAIQNGFHAEGMLLDWRRPTQDVFPIIFGCDIVYEQRDHGPILILLRRMLDRNGECWIGDAGRAHAKAFYERAMQSGFEVSLQDAEGMPLTAPRIGQFQMFVLRHQAE